MLARQRGEELFDDFLERQEMPDGKGISGRTDSAKKETLQKEDDT